MALIVQYARHLAGVAGGTLDEVVAERSRRVWDAVVGRVARDPQANGALERFISQPTNTNRQAAVEDHMRELLAEDAEFGQRLAELAREVPQVSVGAHQTRVTESGPVAVGGAVIEIRGGTSAAGRDLSSGCAATPGDDEVVTG
ncbi:hypothetical protein ABZX39_32370 [Streptomyces collinus]|uniref:hypothetical protein n=1 Tax=Streptomyces collinus TaxID=42684 RepID=UPI0033B37CE0